MKRHDTVTINSRKYDLSISRSWQCKFLEQNESLLTFVGEFDRDVEHSDLGFIRRGTISYEYYWLDRWYNIFRFHEQGGELRNFYCNINMPPKFENSVLDYVDLDIDILVSPDFSYKVLDVEDFETNSAKFDYPEQLTKNVWQAVDMVLELLNKRQFPFDAG